MNRVPVGRALVAAASLLVVLTGCATVPDSGPPVRIGAAPPGDVSDDLSDVRQLPGKPQPGAAPDRIVQGFLSASKSADGQHQISRDFLADPTSGDNPSQDWNDAASTRIITVSSVSVVGTGQVRLVGTVTARLNTDGSYVPVGTALSYLFRLSRIDGEWRITNPPPGLLLLADDFAVTYRAVDVYFLSADGTSVVPDPRYVDVQRAGLATELVRLVLGGPSAFLAPGVATAFPRGTELRSSVVQASPTGSLMIDLTGQAATATRAQTTRMAAQLVWTLQRFDVGLRVTVTGRPLSVPGYGSVLPADAFAGFDAGSRVTDQMGYFVADGRLRELIGPNATGLSAAPQTGVLSAAVSGDGSALAVVHAVAGAQQLLIGVADGTLVGSVRAQTLTRPTWRPDGTMALLVIDGSRLVQIGVDGRTTPVQLTLPSGSVGITEAQLSADGTRLALVVGGRLLVGVLVDDRRGLRVVGTRAIAPTLSDVQGLAWAGASRLLVAGRLAGNAQGPVQVADDGNTATLRTRTGLPAGVPVTAVAASSDRYDVVACAGRIWQLTGGRWVSPLGDPVGPLPGGAPFYPG